MTSVELPDLGFPEPVMSFAVTPKSKGDDEKVGTALRRLHEEDPTLQLRRDPQTGEQLLSGMSQMHVESRSTGCAAASTSKSSCTRRGCRTSRRFAPSRRPTPATRSRRAGAPLASLTSGRGDYHMHFLRYEEVPAHIAQKLIEQTRKAREEAKV